MQILKSSKRKYGLMWLQSQLEKYQLMFGTNAVSEVKKV